MYNIFKKYDDDIISNQYETFLPKQTTNLNIPNRNTSIIIDDMDQHLNMKNAKLYIFGKYVQEDGTEYPPKSNVQLIDNFPAHLIKSMKILKHGKVIDQIDHVGRVSTIKGIISYAIDGNGANTNSGFETSFQGGGNFEALIPLSNLGLGFFEDIKEPVKGGFEIIFTRNHDDDALLQKKIKDFKNETDAKKGKIIIEELKVQIQSVVYEEMTKIKLIHESTLLSQQKKYTFNFKSWQCIEETNIKGKNIKIDLTNEYRNNNPPLFGFVCFQTNKTLNQSVDSGEFDHCNVTNYSFELNGKKYPKELQNLDFKNNKYAQAYDDHMIYKKIYNKTSDELILMDTDRIQFKEYRAIYSVDTTRQPINISASKNKLILNVDFAETLPSNTVCYIILISAVEYIYNIERDTIEENIN